MVLAQYLFNAFGFVGQSAWAQKTCGLRYRVHRASNRWINSLSHWSPLLAMILMGLGNWQLSASAQGQEYQWITSQDNLARNPQVSDVYYRRSIQISNVEQAKLTVTADEAYVLYLNGRQIGTGQSSRQLDQYDVTKLMVRGRNVIAIRATNRSAKPVILTSQIQTKSPGEAAKTLIADVNWKASSTASNGWERNEFDDSRWKPARVIGSSQGPAATGPAATGPAATGPATTNKPQNSVAEKQEAEPNRFQTQPGFVVETVFEAEKLGSLVALAFNEFGHIVASEEGGSLILIYDSNKDGKPDKSRIYSADVKNVHGILPLNGDVFVTGDGPQGNGLYRLIDADRNGSLEETKFVVGFQGTPGEHGAHQMALGPDGFIYVILGNHVQVKGKVSEQSTYRVTYEGDLVQPRNEDPGGHASGIKAPGGTIIRVDLKGESIQTVVGGIRNAFDLAFDAEGALYLHDSDMESDVGAAWYRPTTLFEVSEGAELGWRSGWAQWPNYYLDRIPGLLETGRGSPTGMVFYDHYAYPSKYQRTLFLGDWSEGRVLSVKLTSDGSGHKATAEEFLRGAPMNITDLDVGPDGSLYFSTGGRGTQGGIYRVRWQGEPAMDRESLGEGITRAIRQPQLSSAWARQQVAVVKKELGDEWDETIAGVAFSSDNPSKYRIRALELMQLLGPLPPNAMLIELSRSTTDLVRVKTAQLLGLQNNDSEANQRLREMLTDSSPRVQRAAAESLNRSKGSYEATELAPLLKSSDRLLAFSARRLLERLAADSWKDSFLATKDHRLLVQSCLALMTAQPTKANAYLVIDRLSQTMQGFVSDHDFLDMLRVLQVTLHRSGLSGDDVPKLRVAIANEFPAGEAIVNRELIRLAVYLQATAIIPQAVAYLQGDADLADRMLVGLNLRFLKYEWTDADRFALMKFYEEATQMESGSSVPLYVMNATLDFAQKMSNEEAHLFVMEGAQWPNAALAGLYKFPEHLSKEEFQTLRSLDQSIDRDGFEAEYFKRLRTGITAVLARSGDDASMSYLREVWRRSPERRSTVAIGLLQKPEGENWDYLVRSLPIVDSATASEILTQLGKVEVATEDAESLRQVILIGLRLQSEGENPKPAVTLLQHWIGKEQSPSIVAPENQIKSWQNWYAKKFPNRPDAKLPTEEENTKWTKKMLDEFMDGELSKSGEAEAGKLVFEKAKCASCHRVGTQGKSIGPDMTSVAKRFTRGETLESILYPSHVISDQYATQRIVTTEGTVITGTVTKRSDGRLEVRKSDLSEVTVAPTDIESMQPSKTSLMPSGLLNNLNLHEIRDLFCYMGYIPTAEIASHPKPATLRR